MRFHHLLLVPALLLGACVVEDATEETAPAPVSESQEGGISVPSRDYSRYDPASVTSQRLDPSWRAYAERDRQRRRGAVAGQQPLPPGATGQPAAPPPQPTLSSDLGVDTTEPTAPPTGAEAGRPAGPVAGATGESFETITPQSIQGPPTLPVPEEGGGATALRVQILLDRARFSPGILDGYWGKNSAKAVYWFQEAKGLNTTGEVDRATWDALRQAAGPQRPFLRQVTLRMEDLQGPYTPVPEDVYAQAELDCLCYASPLEQLTERFHVSADLLKQLNPGVNLENLPPGAVLQVPDVDPNIPWDVSRLATNGQAAQGGQGQGRGQGQAQAQQGQAAGGGQIQRLVISKKGFYLHGVDAQGNIRFHLPSTLGAGYDPSPGSGEYKVTLVKRSPDFHYQPKLFHEVPDTEKDAYLPPGPNSPVGLVWMQISKPNYGIHGTAVPDTIGYTSSHGCVRLTNWDALFLANNIRPGVTVEFVD